MTEEISNVNSDETDHKRKRKKILDSLPSWQQTVVPKNNNNNNNYLPLISTAALIANPNESAINDEAVNETVGDGEENNEDNDPYPSSQQHYMEMVRARTGPQDPNRGGPQDSQYDLDLPYIEQDDAPDSPQNPSRYPDNHFNYY